MALRFATLAVALATAAPALAQLPAKSESPMTIDARRIEAIDGLEITARGNAEIDRDELNIFGQVLRSNREFGRIDAEGGVRLKSGLDRFFGPRLRYDTLDDTGSFEQPHFLLQQRDPAARGRAQHVEFVGKGRYRLTDAFFTTCSPGNDDWYLQAKELDLNYETEVGHAESPRLRFFDTTILGAPFASFPLENRRKSGLLTPYYAHSSTRGVEFGIPYYWNIAPEYDDTITPVYMTKRGVLLKNEFRYLDPRYGGELRLEYLPDDMLLQRSRNGISWQHHQTLAPGLQGFVDYNRVSDDRYFIDLTSEVRQASTGNLTQDAYASYAGAFGAAPYSALVRVQRFQTLQDPLAPIVPPYARLPQLNFTVGENDVGGVLDTSLPLEYVRFTHPTLVQGSRASMNPVLSAPALAPGWFFRPKAGLHMASYAIDDPAPGNSRAPGIAVPWFSVDGGLVFDRQARWFGENLTQTLEPRLFYVNVPYRNQDEIPLFDTALADFNFAQLFSENRFGGGDRFGDANQLTAALTTRFLQPGGQEAFRATIGQRYYFEKERVGLTPGTPLRDYGVSDLLASVGGRLFKHWTFDATTQYNERESVAERYSLATRYNPEVAKVVGASYRFDTAALRQIDLSAQWPIRAGWYAVGRYNYSLLDKRLVDGVLGVEYNAGCWVFRAAAQRIQAAANVSSTSFFIQLEFNGIGQVGNDEIVTLLQRSVSGYSIVNPNDPTLVPPSARSRLPFEQVY